MKSLIDGHTEFDIAQMVPVSVKAPVRIAAGFGDAPCCFNGKIEAPEILADGDLIAKWDFAQDISFTIGKSQCWT